MRRWLTHQNLLRTIIATSALSAAVTSHARADVCTVDYEGEVPGPLPIANQLEFACPLFVLTNGESEILDGGDCAPNCPRNESQYQLTQGGGLEHVIVISAESETTQCSPECTKVDLISIDVAEPNSTTGSIQLLFIDGTGNTFQFFTDGIMDGPGGAPDFETIVFPEAFRGLDSIPMISGSPYLGVAIDHIVVDVAPEAVPALSTPSLVVMVFAMLAMTISVVRARSS